MPQFSIVLPVHNGGEHLKICVASILAQTLADSFELLILENASTDGTAEWLASLRDPRVRVLPAERFLSIVENWTRILQVPRSEFMTLIGHDDLLDADFLDTMSTLIDTCPDARLYFAHFRLIDGAGVFQRHCLPVPSHETAGDFLAARLLNIRDSFGTGYVMRSADYDRVGGIPPYESLLYADDSLWMRLMEGSWKATSPRELFSYRYHGQSTSRTSNLQVYLGALEQHQNTLAAIAERDPTVHEALGRYGPEAYFQMDEYLHNRFLRAALAGGTPYPADVPERLRRVRDRFGVMAGTPPRRKKRHRLLQATYRLPGLRWLYQAARRLATLTGQEHRFNG